jgi:hypothetical protein
VKKATLHFVAKARIRPLSSSKAVELAAGVTILSSALRAIASTKTVVKKTSAIGREGMLKVQLPSRSQVAGPLRHRKVRFPVSK